MLSITRKFGERVRLKVGGVVVWVTVSPAPGGSTRQVRLHFDAPPEVEVMREELITDVENNSQTNNNPNSVSSTPST